MTRATFYFFLVFSVFACANEPSATESETESEPPPTGTVVDPVPTGIPAEYEFYVGVMSRYSFRNYPSGACTPPDFGELPQFDGTELSDLAIEIKAQIEEKLITTAPNFNCAYHVEIWICGADCRKVTVWDSRTGGLVRVFSTSLGAHYSPKSNLLILNPPRAVPYEAAVREELGAPEFWLLEEGSFRRLDE